MPRKGAGHLVNRETLAQIMGVSLNTLNAWGKLGMPAVQRGGQGRAWTYNTADVIAWRIDQLVSKSTGGSGPANFDTDRARKMAADADVAELERDKQRGRLVELDVIAQMVRSEYATVRTRFGALPGILAPRLDTARALEFQPVIAEAVDEILTELSADDSLDDDAEAARQRDAAGDQEEDA